jgi:ATP adenylyltransferase
MRVKVAAISPRSGSAVECCLCTGIAENDLRETWNQPVFESPNFVAIPSLGSLVEGWLLIVPKHHFISAAVLPAHLLGEMAQLKQNVCETLAKQYGPVCVFEHGPAGEHRAAGCGVDHAHVHVVPVRADLMLAAQQFLPADVKFRQGTLAECRAAAESGSDYLYVEQPVGVEFVAFHQQFGSQTFRKAIASICGIPNEYNWRDHPNLNKVLATIDRLAVENSPCDALAV